MLQVIKLTVLTDAEESQKRREVSLTARILYRHRDTFSIYLLLLFFVIVCLFVFSKIRRIRKECLTWKTLTTLYGGRRRRRTTSLESLNNPSCDYHLSISSGDHSIHGMNSHRSFAVILFSTFLLRIFYTFLLHIFMIHYHLTVI